LNLNGLQRKRTIHFNNKTIEIYLFYCAASYRNKSKTPPGWQAHMAGFFVQRVRLKESP